MSAPHMKFVMFATFLVTVFGTAAHARSAEEYFTGGAYKYVAGKHQEALIEVEEGLQHYPGDTHLQKLADQLRKMKDQQNPQGGKGNDKNKKDDKNKDKGKNDDKKNPDKDKDGNKKPDENKQPDPQKDPKAQPPGKQPSGAPPPGQMSEDDAKRLLNSFADDEKKEQRERQKLLRKRLQSDQDW